MAKALNQLGYEVPVELDVTITVQCKKVVKDKLVVLLA